MAWKDNRPKPVIGLIGGIGSGKSAIAAMFAAEGCAVIDSDRLSHEILQSAEVKEALRQWLGDRVFNPQGQVIRAALGKIVFNDAEQLARLNQIIHPREEQRRRGQVEQAMNDPACKAVILDTPLLLEVGLNRECDTLVFVETPLEIRQQRVQSTRGWDADELSRREKIQIPLDKKAQVADYCINNSGDQAASQRQVLQILSHLLSKPNGRPDG
jgi:dephospho-CoA kinase